MRAPFLSLEELNTSSAEELAATIAGADAEHQRLEAEDKVESQELAQLDEHIDNAEVAAGAFEETAERLEATYPEGVPDEVVQTLEPVLEALKNVVGFQPGSMKVAVEGLSGKERTRVAVEGLKEAAKKIWEAIKAAFKRMIEFFKSIFTRQGRQRAALEKKLDATIEALEQEAGKADTQTSIPDILYPKSCLLPGGVVPTLEKMTHWANTETRTLLDFHKTIIAQFRDLQKTFTHDFKDVKSMDDLDKVKTAYAEWCKRADSELFEMSHDGTVKSSLGGFQAVFRVSSKDGHGPKSAAILYFQHQNQDVTGHDASSGPVITRDKAMPLLKDLEKAHDAWPDDSEMATISKSLAVFDEQMSMRALSFMQEEHLVGHACILLKEVLRRLNAYARFLTWAYGTVMTVMMGIAAVCGSSVGFHALNTAYNT